MATTFTWTGTPGDWFTASNWQPNGPPPAGSTALIDRFDGPTLIAGDPTVANVEIRFESGSASFTLNGGTIGPGTTLFGGESNLVLPVGTSSTFDGLFTFAPTVTGGQLTIEGASGAALQVRHCGTLAAGFSHIIELSTGTILNDGLIQLFGGSFILNSGSIGGNGTIAIGQGGLLYSNETIGAGQTVYFADQTGHLQLYQADAVVVGPIVNFQAGDQIWLPQHQANDVAYDAATHTLTVSDEGTLVAAFDLTTNGAPITFALRQGPYGPVIVSSQATRIWNGGTSDWYASANWTSASTMAASFPLAGDTVRIGSGLATITAADVALYGMVDSETIILGGTTGAPGGLALQDDTIGQNATIAIAGTNQFGLLAIRGHDVLEGEVAATTHNGQLTIGFADDSRLVATTSASLLAGTSAGILLAGTGTFVNNGAVVVQGGLTIDQHVTVTSDLGGWGTIRLQQGGHLTVDGSFRYNGVQFADSSGIVTIENLGRFQGAIWNMTGGNRIDLANTTVTAVSYDVGSYTLNLLDGTTTIGALTVSTTDGYDGFTVAADGSGGSMITYRPAVQLLQPPLPVPFVAGAGDTVALRDLLIQSFGSIPAQYGSETLGLSYATAANLSAWNYSYWNLQSESVSTWQVNGTTVGATGANPYLPPNPPVAGFDLGQVTLQAGDQIMRNLFLQVPIGNTSAVVYWIETVDPAVASPTIYSGHVDPGDIVQSATRFSTHYVGVLNDNDCGWIADDVAAAAGATMPNEDWSTDPSANQQGGFWRIVYRGSDQAKPVQDWGTLVQPGDIVRMGWNGGGQHTTTVLGTNDDGSIQVYDNVDDGTIGIHPATYWTDTIPESITIYRLDPNHQFLVQGSGNTEFLQGSPYDNLIQPNGGGDTIAAGAGANEIQGGTADLNGITVIDWHQGDTIDITDMPFAGARLAYDSVSGVLQVSNPETAQDVAVTLPTGLPDLFQLAAADGGTQVTVACFAGGTCLRTPGGEVAVEDLRVGDMLSTVADPRHASRVVRWIGRRAIDLGRHRQPDKVRPVRIAAHAFGPGLPLRPLLLSPDHAIYFDNALIPVRCLVDGGAVRQMSPRRVVYWHVELDRHDAVLAEGLPVESFLDTGQRHAFENGGAAIMLDPDFGMRAWEAFGFAPLAVTGQAVARAREVLRRVTSRRHRAR